jgi:hypothetical protein
MRDRSGRRGPTTALAAARSRLRPFGPALSEAPRLKTSPPDGAVAVAAGLRSPRGGGPSCGFPGCPAGTHSGQGGGVSRARTSWHRALAPDCPASRQRWVTNCAPTGVAVEQASNTARGTPRFRRSRVNFLDQPRSREASRHAGPVRPAPVCANCVNLSARRTARPGVPRALTSHVGFTRYAHEREAPEENRLRRPRVAKNRGDGACPVFCRPLFSGRQ